MRKFLFATLLLLAPLMGRAQKYVGGDISLLPTYEEHGVHYLDRKGQPVSDVLTYLGQAPQWNAMRVRLFVDPSKASAEDQKEGAVQNLDYVTRLSQRIKQAGYALMLDFHYSDTWTDPGQHSTPAAWTSNDPAVLADSVGRYTLRCLDHLKAHGAAPDFIQVGNEITYGMMWPTGKCYPDGKDYDTGTFTHLVSYLQAGVKACRESCPEAKIVIHTEMSKAWNVTTFYQTLGGQVDYDIIGLSYYPDWHGTLSGLASTLTTLESQHADKRIMIVETGYGSQWGISDKASAEVRSTWPLSEEGQRKFAVDLVTMLNRHPGVTGLFWWQPEDNEYWADSNPARPTWWNGSLYTQNTGRPLAAMFELQRFVGKDPTGIATVPTALPSSGRIYDLQGRQLGQIPAKGLYIRGGKKIMK